MESATEMAIRIGGIMTVTILKSSPHIVKKPIPQNIIRKMFNWQNTDSVTSLRRKRIRVRITIAAIGGNLFLSCLVKEVISFSI